MHLPLLAALLLGVAPNDKSDAGPLVQALWLIQRHGKLEALSPAADQQTKGTLAKAIGKDGVLTLSEVGGLMEPERFKRLAGDDDRLDSAEINRAVEAAIPE